jgi:hypothetical protein
MALQRFAPMVHIIRDVREEKPATPHLCVIRMCTKGQDSKAQEKILQVLESLQ